jgi:hypothetical protein
MSFRDAIAAWRSPSEATSVLDVVSPQSTTISGPEVTQNAISQGIKILRETDDERLKSPA